MLNKVFAGIMIVSGLLTMTMLYAALAPLPAMQSMFAETCSTPFVVMVVMNWGILIALMGALLIWGALHPPLRKPALIIAGASKIAFIALVLTVGAQYIDGLRIAVIVDSIMIVLFAAYLVIGKPTAPT